MLILTTLLRAETAVCSPTLAGYPATMVAITSITVPQCVTVAPLLNLNVANASTNGLKLGHGKRAFSSRNIAPVWGRAGGLELRD